MLTQSEVARRVRDVVLNIVEVANRQQVQPQLSLQEAKDFLAEFRAIHDLAKSTNNVRLQQQMEIAIAQYTDTFILAGLPNQPLINGKPITPINIRYEGCIDVAIRLGFKVPGNYEIALGRHTKKLLSHLLVEVDGSEVKDYRTSAASGKRIGAAMYPAFNPEVEKVVSEYCGLKGF